MSLGTLIRAMLSWPSLVVAVLVVGAGLVRIQALSEAARPLNMWDALVPGATELQLFPLLILLLWCPAVIRSHQELQREEVLLRFGTWSGAVRHVMLRDLTGALGAILLALAALLSVSSALGLSGSWSIHALEVLRQGGVDTELSATAAAAYFASPWVFLVVQLAGLMISMMAIAAVHAALVIRWRPAIANGVVIVVGLGIVLASSGFLGRRPVVDPAAWINVLWALGSPWALVVTVLMWGLILVVLLSTLQRMDRPELATSARGYRTLAVGSAFVLLPVIVAMTPQGEGAPETEQADPLGIVFAGQYSSLDGFLIVLALPVAFGTVIALKLSHLEAGAVVPVLMRHGSSLRWAGRGILQAGALAYGAPALSVLLVVLTGRLAGRTSPEWGDPVALLAVALAYGGVAALLGLAALILFWTTGELNHWTLLVLAVVGLGYPFFTSPTPYNPLAAFSVKPGTVPSWGPVISQGIVIAVLLVTALVLIRRNPLPRHF